MENEIFAEKPATSTVPIEVWVRIVGDTSMVQLATMEVDEDERVPDAEDEDASSRYWARRIYDELASEFGFKDEDDESDPGALVYCK